jgi:hypothetical protein
MMSRSVLGWTVMMVVLTLRTGVFAQGTVLDPRARELTFEPKSPQVLFGSLDPTLKKWYVPQELYREYGWNQWEYTNYARERYLRYVSITLEGDYLYDLFGRFVTRGWLLYNWKQTSPMEDGSGILRAKQFGDWFDGVVIAMDSPLCADPVQ